MKGNEVLCSSATCKFEVSTNAFSESNCANDDSCKLWGGKSTNNAHIDKRVIKVRSHPNAPKTTINAAKDGNHRCTHNVHTNACECFCDGAVKQDFQRTINMIGSAYWLTTDDTDASDGNGRPTYHTSYDANHEQQQDFTDREAYKGNMAVHHDLVSSGGNTYHADLMHFRNTPAPAP